MCRALQEHNYVLLCLFLLAMYKGRSDERRCILQNCGCRMELLAETEMCELDGGVRLWSRHLHSIISMC